MEEMKEHTGSAVLPAPPPKGPGATSSSSAPSSALLSALTEEARSPKKESASGSATTIPAAAATTTTTTTTTATAAGSVPLAAAVTAAAAAAAAATATASASTPPAASAVAYSPPLPGAAAREKRDARAAAPLGGAEGSGPRGCACDGGTTAKVGAESSGSGKGKGTAGVDAAEGVAGVNAAEGVGAGVAAAVGGGIDSPGTGDAAARIKAAIEAAVAGSSGGGGGGGGSGGISSSGGGGGVPERYSWVPSLRGSKPSRECIRRVRNDIRTVMRDPVPGLFVYPDEDLVTVVHALVTGPFDTPYEGGFYYFVLHCPDDYPHSPPRVRLMTTGGGTVRFNPNLYASGKVCLSILGTWNGPRWSPVQSVSSVLLSIQSLMNENPYHNEPGFEVASNPQDVRDYNDCITHENLRVAVCSMVDDSSLWNSMPSCFQALTRDLFLSFVPRYQLVCEQNVHRDGEKLADPFGQNNGTFRYASIARSIKRIAANLEAESAGDEIDSSPPDREGGTARSVDVTPTATGTATATAAASGGSGSGGGGGAETGAGVVSSPGGAKGNERGSSGMGRIEKGGGTRNRNGNGARSPSSAFR